MIDGPHELFNTSSKIPRNFSGGRGWDYRVGVRVYEVMYIFRPFFCRRWGVALTQIQLRGLRSVLL